MDQYSKQETEEPSAAPRGSMYQTQNTTNPSSRAAYSHEHHPYYAACPPSLHSNTELSDPATDSLTRSLPTYNSPHRHSEYSRFYQYHTPYPTSSHHSIRSEPYNYPGRHHSTPETHRSVPYPSDRFDYYSYSHHEHWTYPASYSRDHDTRYQGEVTAGYTGYAGASFAASSEDDVHIPGTTPPQIGDLLPNALDNLYAPFTKIEVDPLNPNEGFDSPPSHQESTHHGTEDDRKPASVPDYIKFKDDQFTPSPDIGQYNESPISIGNYTHPKETTAAPPLPPLNRAEANKLDTAHSSSNSSSYGASTSSGSDAG